VLTGARFHVLEQSGTAMLRPADLVFTRVVTIDGASIMAGQAPYLAPPHWHIPIIDWRERVFRRRLATRSSSPRSHSR
jgi:hypothetical protein